MIAGGALAVNWGLISLLNLTLIDPITVISQYLLTLGFFPAITFVFLRWQRAFLQQV